MSPTKKHWMRQRRDSLTREQQAALPGICQKWREIALCTEPADRNKAKEAAFDLYRRCGLKRPRKMIWLNSIFELSEELDKSLGQNIVFTDRWHGIRYDVYRGAARYYKEATVKRVERLVFDSVPDLSSPAAILRSGPERVVHERGFTPEWVNMVGQNYGPHAARAFALAEVFDTERHRTMEAVGHVVAECGHVCFYEDSVVFLDRPAVINLDQRGRIHSLNGPAIEYRDGSAVYAIHGIRVQKKLIDTPEGELGLSDILAEENAEIRQAIIAKYGFGRLLKDSRHKVVSKNKGNSLIEFTFPGRKWEPNRRRIPTLRLRLLHLTWRDKTGSKETMLPVPRTLREFGEDRPPNINDCEQVRRWTLGWPKDVLAIAET